ncbi:MAG: LemA family protein [Elusimicrobiaceae bacterium]|nr:LemA family protein [Elusimicrobiaceae bacterium]
MGGAWIMLIIIVVFAIYAGGVYNTLVKMKNSVKEAWSDIEIQLKRRYDLIPNLINTVKGYMQHESGTLEKIVQARAAAMNSSGQMKEMSQNEGMISNALKSIFALAENYPDLKANTNFLELQRELRDTEDKIQASRRFYNGNVLALNTKIEQFPSNIVASIFHFEKQDFFELDAAEKTAAYNPVKVEF